MTQLEFLKKECSFDKGSLKWVNKPADILKYIGQEILFVEFKREDENAQWQTKSSIVKVESITGLDPVFGTYIINYSKENEKNTISERIIPQGFSFNNPDKDNWMHRFVPLSFHYEIGETEEYFLRLKSLWNERETLSLEYIKEFKENKISLRDYNNVVAVINTDIEEGEKCGILAFRIYEISGYKSLKDGASFTIKDEKGNFYSIRQDSDKSEISFRLNGKLIGSLKIIDLINI